MKIIIFLLMLAIVGCTNTPTPTGTLSDINKQCVFEQRKKIMSAWNRYEFDRYSQIWHPDWRSNAMRWAEIECKIGRPVPQFRPPAEK